MAPTTIEDIINNEVKRAALGCGCSEGDIRALLPLMDRDELEAPEWVRHSANVAKVSTAAMAEAHRRARLTKEDERRAFFGGQGANERLATKAQIMAIAASKIAAYLRDAQGEEQ